MLDNDDKALLKMLLLFFCLVVGLVFALGVVGGVLGLMFG